MIFFTIQVSILANPCFLLFACLLLFVISTQVDNSCQAKLPDSFDVRVTRLQLVVNGQIPYDHSEEVNFTIIVPGVEDCTGLRVQIRATNSAGMSQFSEGIPVGEYTRNVEKRIWNVGCKKLVQ